MLGEKIIERDEKRGEMHIFPPNGKQYAYFFFSPIDLKFTKLQKKGSTFFAPPQYI